MCISGHYMSIDLEAYHNQALNCSMDRFSLLACLLDLFRRPSNAGASNSLILPGRRATPLWNIQITLDGLAEEETTSF